MKTLTADQLTAFLQEAKRTGVFEMYYLELATGLRRGELLGLKWSDVDFGQGTLTVRRQISRINGQVVEAPLKTKNAYRVIPLGEQALAATAKPARENPQRVCISLSQWRAYLAGQRAEYAPPGAEAGRAALCAVPRPAPPVCQAHDKKI